MYQRFQKYIQEEQLFSRTDKLLLGVSGGVDSVVLAQLVDQLGNEFALAHCNFNLRGTESDHDQQLVEELAGKMGVKCFFTSFQTIEYAQEKGVSIEMAARELRYNWFEETRVEMGYDCIVVGHHLDDVLETFILNLSRGTGIRGLSGIKPKAGKVVRPLLFATRAEIETFAKAQELQFCYDSSNDDTLIKRNKVRHQIMPLLDEMNPAFRKNLQRTIGYLNQTETVFLQHIGKIRSEIVKQENDWLKIPISELLLLQPLAIYLYELLRPYGFNSEMVAEIEQAFDTPPGQQFFSASHRVVVDRDEIIITPVEQEMPHLFYIEKHDQELFEPEHLKVTVERYYPGYQIPKSNNIALLDYDKLHFPLVLRKWQQGEYFRPLGMDGFKKLSDFFIDEKFSIPEKERAWILASDNKVVWIVGKRIDDRYKITSQTHMVLKIERIDD